MGGEEENASLWLLKVKSIFWFIPLILSLEGVQYQPDNPQVLNL